MGTRKHTARAAKRGRQTTERGQSCCKSHSPAAAANPPTETPVTGVSLFGQLAKLRSHLMRGTRQDVKRLSDAIAGSSDAANDLRRQLDQVIESLDTAADFLTPGPDHVDQEVTDEIEVPEHNALDGVCSRLDSLQMTLALLRRQACDATSKDNQLSAELAGTFDLAEWQLEREQAELARVAEALPS